MRVDLRRDRGPWRLERVQAAAARAGERAPPRNRGAGRWEAGVGAPATRYPVRASGPTVRARRPGVGTRSRRTGVTESSPPTCVPSLEPCRHLLTTELLRRPCAGARFCSARDRPNAVEGGLLAHDSRARAACDCRVQSARRCAASKIGVGSTALSWVAAQPSSGILLLRNQHFSPSLARAGGHAVDQRSNSGDEFGAASPRLLLAEVGAVLRPPVGPRKKGGRLMACVV